jgi:transposase-like protein
MNSTKKPRKQYDLEYKQRIVQEYLRGELTTNALAEREGLERGQIYSWKVQLAERARDARIEEIADTEGVSLDQARQIRELEEELEASQKKIAQLVLENDLLKKIHQDYPSAKKSSGYIETKQLLARSKGRQR